MFWCFIEHAIDVHARVESAVRETRGVAARETEVSAVGPVADGRVVCWYAEKERIAHHG